MDGLGQITAFVGRNGAGKSNVMLGIQWGAAGAVGAAVPFPHEAWLLLASKPGVVFDMILQGQAYRYTLNYEWRKANPSGSEDRVRPVVTELLEAVDQKGNRTSWLTREDETIWLGDRNSQSQIRVGENAPMLSALTSLLPGESPELAVVNMVVSFLSGVRYYPAEMSVARPDSGAIPHERYAQWLNQYRSTGSPSESVAFRLIYMHLERRDQLAQVQEILRDKLGVLSFLNVAESRPAVSGTEKRADQISAPRYYFLRFGVNGSPQPFEYNGLSFGTRRLLRLAVSLVFDASSVMLIEQPEDGVHAGLTQKLVSMFRSYTDSSQIFLATHSTFILNDFRPEELRLVAMQNGVTTVRSLDAREQRVAHDYLLETGSLSDFVGMVEEEN